MPLMCGIAGIFRKEGRVDELSSCLETLRRALKHRGPDDDGVWVNRHGLVGFAHTRLSILDTSNAGHQPMRSSDGRLVITFNGEIYNFRELRQGLEKEGVQFHTATDTEVILALYERRGAACLNELRGMFAFAIWDEKERRGFLARDRFGMKPFYLAETNGVLSFASEVKALQEAGLCGGKLNANALATYFEIGSVPEPHTLLEGVRCLPAGHWLEWCEGRTREVCYWSPDFNVQACENEEATAIVHEALKDSLRHHLVSDVPVGVFLSGGLDSTAILSLMSKSGRPPPRTFSVGVDDPKLDESAAARRTAEYYKSDHCELMLDGSGSREIFDRYLVSTDQPSIDGFNSFTISELASREGIKAVVSGLGGDELFGGYASFRQLPIMLDAARGIAHTGSAGRWVGAGLERFGPNPKWRRIGGMLQRAPGLHAAQNALRGVFSPLEARRLAAHYAGVDELTVSALMPGAHDSQPTLGDEISALELGYYMRNQMLKDTDVMTMACGLELRLPFVDHILLSKLACIPSAQRLQAGKRMLLESLVDLPPWVTTAQKRGFVFPYENWMATHWKDRFSDATLGPKGLTAKNWYQRWALFAFQHWSSSPGGNVGVTSKPLRVSRLPIPKRTEVQTTSVDNVCDSTKGKRRVLFISNLFPDSTAPYFGLDNATVLHELRRTHGWDVSVVCPRPTLSLKRLARAEGGWKCREQDAVLKPQFIPVPYMPRVGSRINHQLMALRLRSILGSKAGDFDVLLASWLYPDGCAAAMIAREVGRPCVLITQGSDTHQYLQYPQRRRLILKAITQTHGVIARSRDLARCLAEAGADAGKLHPIYNGVDLTVFRPRPQAEVRAQLGLSADARIALFVGNFLDVKNPLMLVRAFADFVKGTPEKNNLLMMAGRGPMLDEVRNLAAKLGMADRVVLTGPLDSRQIALRMAAADFLCLSSRNEGLPNVILEAFACGLPVLSTDVGGISEVVNDPARGLLVTPGDQNAYTQGLKHMTATIWPRDVIAEAGAHFSWKNAASGYDTLLSSAVSLREERS